MIQYSIKFLFLLLICLFDFHFVISKLFSQGLNSFSRLDSFKSISFEQVQTFGRKKRLEGRRNVCKKSEKNVFNICLLEMWNHPFKSSLMIFKIKWKCFARKKIQNFVFTWHNKYFFFFLFFNLCNCGQHKYVNHLLMGFWN